MKNNLCTLWISILFTASAHAAVSVPYSNNFGSSAADFVTNGGTWTVSSGTYRHVIGAADTPTSAAVQATALAGQSFTVSTDFVINSIAGTTATATVGLAALGSTNSFLGGSSSNTVLLADVSMSGGLRFVTLGSTTGFYNAGNWTGGSLVVGTTYNLSLTGIYQPNGSLALTLTLTDGVTPTSITQTLSSAQAPAGTYFGYRNRTNAATSLDIGFDNFSLTQIPEPSSAALALLTVPLAFTRRRRN